MGKRKIVDDDDEDVAVRGRPRDPEEFGPPKAAPHQREPYARRLQSILDALEIAELGRDERQYLQRTLWRADFLHSYDPARFAAHGEASVIVTLRTIAESENGADALVLPVIKAVSFSLCDAFIDRGLELFNAMDQIRLLDLHSTLRNLGLEQHLGAAIRYRLAEILGPPPPLQQPQPTKPVRKRLKPDGISGETWAEVQALRKADRRRGEQKRRAARLMAA
jgi:hypothetical protein